MDNFKYYDLVDKTEVMPQDIKKHVPYIVLENKWKVRIVEFGENGKIENERFLTPAEEEIAKIEILRQKFIQNGYDRNNIDITKKDSFEIDGISINVPNYQAVVVNKQGEKGAAYFNTQNLEGMVKNTEKGKEVQLNEIPLSNEELIEAADLLSDNRSNGLILNINQWGYKRTYNLSNKVDVYRLMEDQKTMPRNKREAMEQGMDDSEKTIH